MLKSKVTIILIVLVLIPCTLVDGWLFKRRKRVPKCKNPRSIPHYRDTEMKKVEQDESENEKKPEAKDSKRVAAGTVIAASQLDINVLQKVLGFPGGFFERKIAIGISNNTPYKWEGIGVYFLFGSSRVQLPRYVNKDEAAVYSASGLAVGGVICYYISAQNKSLCAMFNVPNSFMFHSNSWDAEIYTGKVNPGTNVFAHLAYFGEPQKGDNKYHQKDLCHGFVLKDGYMNSAGDAVLALKIETD